MSLHCRNPPEAQTFQSSAALVKLTGVCDTFSDSTDEEEDVQDVAPTATESSPSENKGEIDSPTWITTSWKSDSGFNSDAGTGIHLEQEDQDNAPVDWQYQNSLSHTCVSSASTDPDSVVVKRERDHVLTDSAIKDSLSCNIGDSIKPLEKETEERTSASNGENDENLNRNVVSGTVCNSEGYNLPHLDSGGNRVGETTTDNFNEQDTLTDSSRISNLVRHPLPNGVAPAHERHNPFNKIPLIEENHFDDTQVVRVKKVHQDLSPPEESAMSTASIQNGSHVKKSEVDMDDEFDLWEQNILEMITDTLNVEEDYFAQPEGFFGYSRDEELEQAIQKCKERVMNTPEDSEKRHSLVQKLVQLRLKRQELKDLPEVKEDNVKKVLGHLFSLCEGKSQASRCDVCATSMWNRLRATYLCKECGFSCHFKCIDTVKRHCVAVKLSKGATYDLSICPEDGLAAQSYRCADCKIAISFKGEHGEPRQCDYTGQYYCQICHWNDVSIIPARVVHNWDFTPRKICRQSKQLLDLMRNRVVVNLSHFNPGLFNRVEGLTNIKKLREDILLMKLYFTSCKYAKEARLLRMLEERPHFVECADNYTLRDMVETHEEQLYDTIKEVHKIYSQHIRIECDLCKAKGFICELCRAEELIFPFDIFAIVCSKCSAVYHRDCFFKKKGVCPKCERLAKQASVSSTTNGLNDSSER